MSYKSKTRSGSVSGEKMEGVPDCSTLPEDVLTKICTQQAAVILMQLQPTLDKIDSLSSTIEEIKVCLTKYSMDVLKIGSKVEALELKCDKLEQYSRRNNLRVYGIPERVGENSDLVLLSFFQEKLGIQLQITDIDRSHRTGKKLGGEHPRPLLVKFVSYRSKAEIFGKKKVLKGSGCVIKEDLTQVGAQLLKSATEKYGKNCVWTSDGRIILVKADGQKMVVESSRDLQ